MTYKELKNNIFIGLKRQRAVRVVILLLIIFSIVWFFSNKLEKKLVRAGNCEFKVELASSPSQQYQGLSDRQDLGDNEGMLFIFPQAKDQSFVMRKMNFSLDIVFIRDFKVVNLYHNLEPEGAQPSRSYHSGSPVDAVLEIKGGLSRACKIAINSEVNW